MAQIVSCWPSSLPVQKDLCSLISPWGFLQGFDKEFSPASLTDLLNLDMQSEWPSLLSYCQGLSRKEAYSLTFQFSLVVFGNTSLALILQTLLAFATLPGLKRLGQPPHLEYNLEVGTGIDLEQVRDLMSTHQRQFVLSEEEREFDDGNDPFELQDLDNQRQAIEMAVRRSCPDIILPSSQELHYFDVDGLEEDLCERAVLWEANIVLHQKLREYEVVLGDVHKPFVQREIPKHVVRSRAVNEREQHSQHPSLLSLFMTATIEAETEISARSWRLTRQFDGDIRSFFTGRRTDPVIQGRGSPYRELRMIVNDLAASDDKTTQEHGKILDKSTVALTKMASGSTAVTLPDKSELEYRFTELKNATESLLSEIQGFIEPVTPAQTGILAAGLWPRPTPVALLRLLNQQSLSRIPLNGRRHLIMYGRSITALQRIVRMLRFLEIGDEFALRKELENEAHERWNVEAHPEWLLLEIQNDMLIRPVQVRVAEEILKPENGIIQLGMGEGKTSVILPMVITALADGSTLVRVVILKSLVNEMLQGLSRNLSGLVNRPVYYLPFSRSTTLTPDYLSQIRVLWRECKESHGVLLALPEHINSFRLIGHDKQISHKTTLARGLLQAQKWLDCNVIDVQDESDEILNPRNELVYTNGNPEPLHGTPERWGIIIDILSITMKHAKTVSRHIKHGIEYRSKASGAFPTIRLLNEAGSELLTSLVLRDIEQGNLPQLNLRRYPTHIIHAVMDFIRIIQINGQTDKLVRKTFFKHTQMDCLFLLRGLFAFGNLRSSLQKRWFIEYGLDRSRCLSAVPYRARSTPAAAAEFAQPDAMILLTTLSYYYTGLEIEDSHHAIALLLKSTDPVDEYSRWVANASIPKDYQRIGALNLESDTCIEQLYPYFRFNIAVIDFFLKQVVFPKEAKQFPHKLSTSAWDLCAGSGKRVVSGFSGTCDVLLPLTVKKQDVPELQHYDAAILADLLKPRNRRYIRAADSNGQSLSTGELLVLLGNEDLTPSVIIDVGAQVMEVNRDVAATWLKIRKDKLACVYFNDTDEKVVLTRDGRVEQWKASPFREQISKCLIFLDQFHTRGTDFQLPDDFKAAVLLGPKLQKDDWVQACMRMRKLTFSQSVVFVAPPEVDHSIRTVLNLDEKYRIESLEIIRWTIQQSCKAKDNQRSLWITRGLGFKKRDLADQRFVTKQGIVRDADSHKERIRESEDQRASVLYPVLQGRHRGLPYSFDKRDRKDSMVQTLLSEWRSIDVLERWSSAGQDEQEREMMHEVEQEREIERPLSVHSSKPSINRELLAIIQNNRVIRAAPETLSLAFSVLSRTSLTSKSYSASWPKELLATNDFLWPVKIPDGSNMNDYLRPVQWVLKLHDFPILILISPHEASAYLPHIKRSKTANVIIYSAHIKNGMKSFEELDVLSLPSPCSLVGVENSSLRALRLFSGQLYFDSLKQYYDFCESLGLWDGIRSLTGTGNLIDDDLFVKPYIRVANGWTTSRWKTSPVDLLKEWISMRQQGIDWDHTHVGRVLNGRVLTARDFVEA